MSLTRRVLTASALSAGLVLSACGGGGSTGRAGEVNEGDFSKGAADAPVTVIEYASVACGACAEFHEEVWPMVETEFVETGQVRFVLREMLTGSRDIAVAGFLLARCLPEDRYFDAVDMLFDQQRAIFVASQVPGGTRNQFIAIANSFGLNESEFDQCMADGNQLAAINASNAQALEDGISGTPAFIINGRLLDSRAGTGEYRNRGVYYWGDEQLLIDGEQVPAMVDEETFRALMQHFVDEAAG